MKILITGKKGQLGQQLQQDAPADTEIIALGHDQLDIANKTEVIAVVFGARPDVVINAAAYTAVDQAETERDKAYSVNATGPENLALACKEACARLIQISTDFVFSGKQSIPYKPYDAVDPLSVYGASKAAGEAAIQAILPETVIIRTSWVYAAHGNNFVNTMLRLMNERDQLGVVADQIGSPTWAGTLARTIFALVINEEAHGIYHCTDAGVASWYDFAVAIYEEGKQAGLIPAHKKVSIMPITTAEYPTPAKRPAYSVLDKSRLIAAVNIELTHWRQILRNVLAKKGTMEFKCSKEVNGL